MKQQIETALQAFSGADLRAASIGLLNTLGYQSKKTLDLDNTRVRFLIPVMITETTSPICFSPLT